MQTRSAVHAAWLALVVSLLVSCQVLPERPAEPLAGAAWNRLGLSGAAPLGAAALVVHDSKFDAKLPRVGVIEMPAVGPARYQSVAIEDWRGRVADDLEGVCALPDRRDEFLTIESSHRTG